MSLLPIDLFHVHSVCFPHGSHVFVTCRRTWSSFSSHFLPFSSLLVGGMFLHIFDALVLDRFVRQRVHNYGHDMYIINTHTHWLIETCLFVCNVGIYIFIYTWEWICIIISISIYIYINTIRHWNIWIWCVAVILSALVLCVPHFFLEKMPSFYVLVFRYTYMIMYVCMYVWM